MTLALGHLHPDHLKASIGEHQYAELLHYVIDSGHLDRIRHREDWRDRTLGLIAFFLSVIASGHKLSKPFELDKLAAPYLAKLAKPKTPEQRLREARLRAIYARHQARP